MHQRLLLTAAFVALLLHQPAAGGSGKRPFMRGMVVSCPRWGPIWGSPDMSDSLSELASLGVNRVAIHPYSWVKKDGSVRFEPAAELDFLAKAVELARNANIELFWKPHLGYWGSFSHRGAIDFGDDPAAWARFFSDYQAFIVDQARFAEAAGVDLFAVGVELDATTRYEELWRRIIRSVRAVYSGRIVYAANWDRLDAIPFWDAIDLIGVHAYFPLSETEDPGRQAIFNGWDEPLAALERLSDLLNKEVLIAEIGYNSSPSAARTPWAYESVDSDAARELRSRLIDIAIARLEQAEFISGMFWWKWMPGNGRSRNFSMRAREAQNVLERHWGKPAPRVSAPR